MKLKDGRVYEGAVVREGVEIFAPAGPRRAEALDYHGRHALQQADALWTRAAISIAAATKPSYASDLGATLLAVCTRDERIGLLSVVGPELAWGSTLQAAGQLGLAGERAARRGLARSVDAFNFLEKHPDLGAVAHRRLHVLGELVSALYGCQIRAEGRTFADTCPVSLAHKRLGLSPGFTAIWRCSACGEDFSECDHDPGELVDVVVDRPEGRCSICWLRDCERHVSGTTLKRRVGRIVTEANLDEVSIVARPRDPLARLTRIDLRRREAQDLLRSGLLTKRADGWAQCLRCQSACTGFLSVEDVMA